MTLFFFEHMKMHLQSHLWSVAGSGYLLDVLNGYFCFRLTAFVLELKCHVIT